MERISARDVTDTHRRCLCAAAAATFGLAWQLWAREPLEDPHQRDDYQAPAPAAVRSAPRRQDRTPERLAQDAQKAICASELSQDGIRTLLLQFCEGEAIGLADLPVAALRSIPKLVQYPDKVALLNQGMHTVTKQPLLEASDDANGEDDPPMAWAT